MEINEQTRARTIWILVAVAAAYSLVNVLLFYTTESFGPVWFATSIAVYVALGIVALTLAFVDTGGQTVHHTHNVHQIVGNGWNPDQSPARSRLVFENEAGRLLEEQAPSTRKRHLYVETEDGLRSVDEIEAELDEALSHVNPNHVPLRDLEAALDAITSEELHSAVPETPEHPVEVNP